MSVYVPEFVIPDPLHPVWDRAGLGPTGRDVVLCFSLTEPRSQAEAMRLGGPSQDTFRKRRIQLVEMGALLVVGSQRQPRYVINEQFDWDAWVDESGLAAVRAEAADRRRTRTLIDRRNWIERHEPHSPDRLCQCQRRRSCRA